MDSNANSPPAIPEMISISHSIVTGGTFTQHNHDNRQVQILQTAKTGFDRLQDAVAPGAFHNSGERFDPPKCHPNTRVAVLKKIMDWILGQDSQTKNALITWLHGAAGAGKSAIAQSIAEVCCAQGILIASFFFGRSDPNRNHARSIFPTIAYQMALALPQVREKLVAAIEYDPLIFTRSLSTQFLSLIVGPLRELVESGFFNDSSSPRLVLIDGLDECLDGKVQRELLDVILHGIHQHRLPLILLIASRPEHDISTKFASPEMSSILAHIVLDNSYFPDDDINLFLRDKFEEIQQTHPFKGSIPINWPTDHCIANLVRKSSGQFIYASTVVKYLQSGRHRPHHRLDIVLNIRPAKRDLPFAELDALYTHIFSSVDEIEQVLDVLTFCMWSCDRLFYVHQVEKVLSLDPGDIEMLFCDLGSIVSLAIEPSDGQAIFRILHASLPDYLLDQSRSNKFHINTALKSTEHICKCLVYTMIPSTYGKHGARYLAMQIITRNYHHCVPSARLRDNILSFSISNIYAENEGLGFIPFFNRYFLPEFFVFLYNSKFDDAGYLYTHHLRSFDEVLKHHLDVYYADKSLTLLVALVDFIRAKRNWLNSQVDIRILELEPNFQLFYISPQAFDTDENSCTLMESSPQYLRLFSDFLEDTTRSGPYALDEVKYATSALTCLIYLCDHTSASEAVLVPRNTRRRIEIRRNTPWMWLKRVGRHGALDKSRIWHKKQGDLIYSREKAGRFWEADMGNPVILERVRSNKYSLGLEYLLYFLPRSGRSEELIEFATRHTFASRSQEFPNRSKKARKALTAYLERVKCGHDDQ